MVVEYRDSLEGITAEMLDGFCGGWSRPLSPDKLLDLLRRSKHIALAYDPKDNHVVGFINALSDGVLSAYIPLLEVLPSHRGRGIGGSLVRCMLDQLGQMYMVDLCCDEKLIPFYTRQGFTQIAGMVLRRPHNLA